MKKGKPPRRRCPHLRLTVVRQAGSSVLLGPELDEQTQREGPGEMGSGDSGPGVSQSLLTAGGHVVWQEGEPGQEAWGLEGTFPGTLGSRTLPRRSTF